MLHSRKTYNTLIKSPEYSYIFYYNNKVTTSSPLPE